MTRLADRLIDYYIEAFYRLKSQPEDIFLLNLKPKRSSFPKDIEVCGYSELIDTLNHMSYHEKMRALDCCPDLITLAAVRFPSKLREQAILRIL